MEVITDPRETVALSQAHINGSFAFRESSKGSYFNPPTNPYYSGLMRWAWDLGWREQEALGGRG